MRTPITILVMFFFACQKQDTEVIRISGARPDMPNSVQVIASTSFNAKNKSEDVIVSKGKPVKQPSVSFVSPANGATVSGTVLISVTIRNATSVTISINGIVVSNTTSYSWNTTGLPSGFYQLSATARDAAGNSRTTSITVSINTIIVEPPQPVSGVQITMPPVLNQGSEGSCVAFSVGYAARSVEYFNATGISKTFSPEHLYNNVKFDVDCNSGTAMQTALEFIMANGILPWGSMPYTSGDCSNTGTEVQKQEALTYKIAGYFKIYTTDSSMIKGMIRQNKPVIISIAGDNSFLNAGAGFVWKVYSGSGYIAHSVVICGYDDSKNAYRIMNSFGTNWGDAGYCWIDYDFFLTRTGTWCYAIR